MAKDLQAALHPRSQKAFVDYFRLPHNPEILTVCEFGMPSKMPKRLRPSVEFYRKFAQGRIE
jgi:hypothetical protein